MIFALRNRRQQKSSALVPFIPLIKGTEVDENSINVQKQGIFLFLFLKFYNK